MSDKTSDIARTDTLEYWETCAREAESENGVLGLAVEHWHQVAETLKQQRNIAEAERDDWRIRAMQSEQQRQALLAERDALRKECNEALEMLSFTSETSLWQAAAAANQEVGYFRAERDALRKDAARLYWLESRKSYSISDLGGMACAHLWVTDGEDVRVTKTVTKPTIREAIDAAMEAKV